MAPRSTVPLLESRVAHVVSTMTGAVNVYHIAMALNMHRQHKDLERVRVALDRAHNVRILKSHPKDPYLTTFVTGYKYF